LIGSNIDSTALTFTVSSSIIGGTTYQFRVRAKNYWGWGSYSSTVSIKAAKAPAQMSSAVTSIDTATGGVKILWTAPNTNSDTITAYKIEMLDHTGTTWSQDLVHCDGTNSVIKSNLYCIVPMSVLITAPFN
jgi:hypothetical protein